MNISNELKKILGGTYGGPSIGLSDDNKKLVIYVWYDAPVNMEILAQGDSLSEVIENFKKTKRYKRYKELKGK